MHHEHEVSKPIGLDDAASLTGPGASHLEWRRVDEIFIAIHAACTILADDELSHVRRRRGEIRSRHERFRQRDNAFRSHDGKIRSRCGKIRRKRGRVDETALMNLHEDALTNR